MARFHKETVTIDKPFVLLDVGQGGLSVISPMPFIPGEDHTFRLEVLGRAIPVPVVAIHCLRVNRAEAWPEFICGFATEVDLSEVVDLLLSMLPAPMNGKLPEVSAFGASA